MEQYIFDLGLTTSLETEFTQLSKECVEAFDQKSAADSQISFVLARAYLLWRKLGDEPTVLATIYANEGFPAPTAGAPDFTTYLKILFRLELPAPTQVDKSRYENAPPTFGNKISGYKAVVDNLHAAYSEHPENFQREPLTKLKDIIDRDHGVSGARAARAHANATKAAIANGLQVGNSSFDDTSVLQSWITQNAIGALNGRRVVTTVSVANPRAIASCMDSYQTWVVRIIGNGQGHVLAVSHDNDDTHAVAVRQARRASSVQGKALHAITETIATQSYPGCYCPAGSRVELTGAFGRWYSRVYLEKGDSGQLAPRRLLVASDAILLSSTDMAAGVITLLKPNHAVLDASAPSVCLDDLGLRTVEHWVEAGIAAARRGHPLDALKSSPSGHRSDMHLLIKCASEEGKVRGMYFADATKLPTRQVDLALSGFTAQWTFTAEPSWFARLRADFLDKWFRTNAAGTKLSRPEHRMFRVGVSADTFTIQYEMDETGYNPSHQAKLGDEEATCATLSGPQAAGYLVSAKDFAPIFHNIARLDVVGPVTVSGNASLVMLEFETAIGKYQIGVPTVTPTKAWFVRDPAHMKLV